MQAWRIDVLARPDQLDPIGDAAQRTLSAGGLLGVSSVRSRRGYLLGAELTREQVDAFTRAVLCDPVIERYDVHAPGAGALKADDACTLTIVPKPGVTDPVAHSVQKALGDMELPVVMAGTYRTYDVHGDVATEQLLSIAREGLANDTVQQILVDALPDGLPGESPAPDLTVHDVPLHGLDEAALVAISKEGGLALDGHEMKAIQAHFDEHGRAPTRLELETLAQTFLA